MFTGIVAATGSVEDLQPRGADMRLVINAGGLSLFGCSEGDSIAVSGVCLTMLNIQDDQFCADVSTETLEKTTLGQLKAGNPVNLELAMQATDRLGGHIVSGHVDGVGHLVSRYEDGRAERFEFKVPVGLKRFIAEKGSVCINGVSLTVNEVNDDQFSVCLIPHTLEVTTLGDLQVNDKINIEVDLMARYLDRLLSERALSAE